MMKIGKKRTSLRRKTTTCSISTQLCLSLTEPAGGMAMSAEEQIDAKNFYDSAVLFCKKAESLSNAACLNTSDLTLLLMQIYTSAMHLPNTEPSTWTADEKPTSLNISFGNRDCYWEIFDPFILEEPVCGSLSDDLRSIFVDADSKLQYHKILLSNQPNLLSNNQVV